MDNSDKSRGCDRIKDNYKQECRLKRHVHYEPNHRSNSNCRNPNSRTFDIFWLVINLNETNFVKEWKDLALIKECIFPDGSNRNNHRQDQAVLCILYYKYFQKYKFKKW